jgi:hypothetical protein
MRNVESRPLKTPGDEIMKGCSGIPPGDYHRDSHNRRFSVSPMLHFPDYCPYYDEDAVGDCLAKCAIKTIFERPCATQAFEAGFADGSSTSNRK